VIYEATDFMNQQVQGVRLAVTYSQLLIDYISIVNYYISSRLSLNCAIYLIEQIVVQQVGLLEPAIHQFAQLNKLIINN